MTEFWSEAICITSDPAHSSIYRVLSGRLQVIDKKDTCVLDPTMHMHATISCVYFASLFPLCTASDGNIDALPLHACHTHAIPRPHTKL